MPTSFKCPMCAAPLDFPGGGAVTMRCPYCENSVIIPEELRGGHASAGHAQQSAGGGFAPVINQALKIAEVAQLARSGNKIAAIKLYRETFGCGLKEAKDAVERIERGEPISLTEMSVQSAGAYPQQPGMAPLMQGQNQGKSGGGRCLILGIVLIVAVAGAVMLFGGGAAYFFNRQVQTLVPNVPGGKTPASGKGSNASGFASVALEFGSEGIGAGQFKDARSVAVDGEGRIYTAEYTGGRVQVFDSQGKFLTQWMVDPKMPLLSMAADRKGTVYIVQRGAISRYEGETGRALGEIGKQSANGYEQYSYVYVALDGSLYAIGSNYNIIRIGADGRIRSTINVKEKTGEDLNFDGLAVSGNGYIYAVERREKSVFKFGPDGKFINRFGGEGKDAGQLSSPTGIAVDGQGRVYVCDVGRGVQVFDGNGRYLDSFGGNEVIFEIAINDQNEIFGSQRNRHKVVKYVLGKP
jgi:DNA-binding beta-propeller fold protein YncE